MPFPISTEEDLIRALSSPYAEDVELARRLEGDVIVLGAGGKMGPTLVRRIVTACRQAGRETVVHAVSRYSDAHMRREVAETGAHLISADLLDEKALVGLPDCPNVIYLVGMKFGAMGRLPLTWAMNAYLPGRVAVRYRDSRIVALSTGNVYPKVAPESGGCTESHDPEPVGEYAQSCLGRERIFQHFSGQNGTPICLLRLNYAVEARYGVLLDIAMRVQNREPISLAMGHVNTIWQGDANSICFRALEICESPAAILNVTGPDILSVRDLAYEFGKRFGVRPVFSDAEEPTALLSDAARCRDLFGPPHVSVDTTIDLVAEWVDRGRPTYGKPTKFDVRDGRF